MKYLIKTPGGCIKASSVIVGNKEFPELGSNIYFYSTEFLSIEFEYPVEWSKIYIAESEAEEDIAKAEEVTHADYDKVKKDIIYKRHGGILSDFKVKGNALTMLQTLLWERSGGDCYKLLMNMLESGIEYNGPFKFVFTKDELLKYIIEPYFLNAEGVVDGIRVAGDYLIGKAEGKPYSRFFYLRTTSIPDLVELDTIPLTAISERDKEFYTLYYNGKFV